MDIPSNRREAAQARKEAAASPKVTAKVVRDVTVKKHKTALIVAIIVLAIVAVVAAIVLSNKAAASNVINDGNFGNGATVSQYLLEDGGSLVYAPGSTVYKESKPNALRLTGDRLHTVSLEDGGALVVYDQDGTAATVSDQASGIRTVNNSVLVYEELEGKVLVSYNFATKSKMFLPSTNPVVFSANSAYLAYFDANDTLYLASVADTEGFVLSQMKTKAEVLYISNDGKTVVWVEYGEDEDVVYCYDQATIRLLAAFEDTTNLYCSTHAMVNSADSLLVIYNESSNIYYIKSAATGEFLTVALPDGALGRIHTQMGLLQNDGQTLPADLYISLKSLAGYNVYYVDLEKGERTQVVADVTNFYVVNNQAFYVDDDSALYTASLNGATMGTPTMLDSDVVDFAVSPVAQVVLYAKNHADATEDLYVYAPATGSKLVATGAYAPQATGELHWYRFALDGSSVFFYQQCEAKDGFVNVGELCVYSVADQKVTQVAQDVLVYSVTSNIVGETYDVIDSQKYAFRVYDHGDGIVEAYFTLYSAENGEIKAIAQGVAD